MFQLGSQFTARVVPSRTVTNTGRDGSRHALGQTAAGRYLHVIYVPDEEGDSVFVVTAYEIRGKPLQAYKRRRRR
jgi:hypothetical protein